MSGNISDIEFEMRNGSSIGIGKGDKGDYYLTNEEPSWMRLPKELGSKKVSVISSRVMKCKCGEHMTKVYELENKMLCFYCEKAKGYAWASKR